MFEIYDGKTEFTQWDINQKLVVNDRTIKEVHFNNALSANALVCVPYEFNGLLVVDVPNILLQEALRLYVYAFCGECVRASADYEVKPRVKPSDYVYTETEVKTYAALDNRLTEVEKDIKNKADKNSDVMGSGHFVDNLASTQNPHIEGVNNAIQQYSGYAPNNLTACHVEGGKNIAASNYCHAEGLSTKALGSVSHSEGNSTTASGTHAHAEGIGSTASGSFSHAQNCYTTASGIKAHAEGNRATASGENSHAGGSYSTAGGTCSFAHGNYVKATHNNQTAFGEFNLNKTNTLFEIGNGTADNSRSNAFEVTTNGIAYAGQERLVKESELKAMENKITKLLDKLDISLE